MTNSFGCSRSAVEVLVFLRGRFIGSLMFTLPEITIGRDPDSMVCLDDSSISRRHALLRFDGRRCEIEDIGSLSGVLVSGVQITVASVKPTDDIAIGPFRLRLTVHRANDEPARARSGMGAGPLPGQSDLSEHRSPEPPEALGNSRLVSSAADAAASAPALACPPRGALAGVAAAVPALRAGDAAAEPGPPPLGPTGQARPALPGLTGSRVPLPPPRLAHQGPGASQPITQTSQASQPTTQVRQPTALAPVLSAVSAPPPTGSTARAPTGATVPAPLPAPAATASRTGTRPAVRRSVRAPMASQPTASPPQVSQPVPSQPVPSQPVPPQPAKSPSLGSKATTSQPMVSASMGSRATTSQPIASPSKVPQGTASWSGVLLEADPSDDGWLEDVPRSAHELAEASRNGGAFESPLAGIGDPPRLIRDVPKAAPWEPTAPAFVPNLAEGRLESSRSRTALAEELEPEQTEQDPTDCSDDEETAVLLAPPSILNQVSDARAAVNIAGGVERGAGDLGTAEEPTGFVTERLDFGNDQRDDARRADDDEDEDEDRHFVPPFDMLDALTLRAAAAAIANTAVRGGTGCIAEMIQHQGGRVGWIRHALPGRRLRVPGVGAIGRHVKAGAVTLDIRAFRSVSVSQGRQALSREQWEKQLEPSGNLLIPIGQQASVELPNGEMVFIHVVAAAKPLARASSELIPTREHLWQAVSSVGAHLAVLALAVFATLGQPAESRSLNEGRFAKINLATIELEPPPPAPQPVQASKSTTKVPATSNETNPHPVPVKVPVRHEPTPSAGARESGSAQSAPPSARKILSALGGGASSTSTSAFGAAALTNLDAVGETTGGGGFKVSGVIGKLPGDGLRVGAAGSGTGRAGADTKSLGELGGSDLGKVEAKASGAVRARVTSAPQAVGGEGFLDRGQIQRVVNAHVHQVQGCYERQLVKAPTLAGKITFEWVISTSGAVSVVRIRGSSLPSSEVASCIQSAISGWRFPAPSGGTVTVTYPFAFSALAQ